MKNLFLLILGPLMAFMIMIIPSPDWIDPPAWRFIALVVWILIWWISEIVPIAVTSLLPLVLFPVFGILSEENTASHYAHPVIFLLLGGFFLAESLKKWELHRRFAYFILYNTGRNLPALIGGLMIATACLSMWISNTATSIMMAAIGLSVVHAISEKKFCTDEQIKTLGKMVFFSIAYSASIGGITTLVGTAPNMLFASFMDRQVDTPVSMLEWTSNVFPFVVIMGFITWGTLVIYFSSVRKIPISRIKHTLQEEREKLPPLESHQWIVVTVFVITGLLWIVRLPLSQFLDIDLSDSMIAIGAAVVLFTIPRSIRDKAFLLDWETAREIPWGILLMFGAGLVLATAFRETGLDATLTDKLSGLTYLPNWAILLVLVTFAIFLTELISNTAAIVALLPLLLTVSSALAIPFVYLAIPVTIVCSAAFMLPIATPPNAVAFSFRYFSISEMARFGVLLNIMTVALVMAMAYAGWL